MVCRVVTYFCNFLHVFWDTSYTRLLVPLSVFMHKNHCLKQVKQLLFHYSCGSILCSYCGMCENNLCICDCVDVLSWVVPWIGWKACRYGRSKHLFTRFDQVMSTRQSLHKGPPQKANSWVKTLEFSDDLSDHSSLLGLSKVLHVMQYATNSNLSKEVKIMFSSSPLCVSVLSLHCQFPSTTACDLSIASVLRLLLCCFCFSWFFLYMMHLLPSSNGFLLSFLDIGAPSYFPCFS